MNERAVFRMLSRLSRLRLLRLRPCSQYPTSLILPSRKRITYTYIDLRVFTILLYTEKLPKLEHPESSLKMAFFDC